METLYQILNRYFMLHAGISPDETLDFTPARKVATFTKRGANASLAITAPATWNALGTNPRHTYDERGITTQVRAEHKNYQILAPEKAVYAWVKQSDRQIMAGHAHGVYELRAEPFVWSYDSRRGWLELPQVQLDAMADRAIELAFEKMLKAHAERKK